MSEGIAAHVHNQNFIQVLTCSSQCHTLISLELLFWSCAAMLDEDI